LHIRVRRAPTHADGGGTGLCCRHPNEGEGGAVRKPYVAPEMKVLGAVDALTLITNGFSY